VASDATSSQLAGGPRTPRPGPPRSWRASRARSPSGRR
jgi:hypothetical protein